MLWDLISPSKSANSLKLACGLSRLSRNVECASRRSYKEIQINRIVRKVCSKIPVITPSVIRWDIWCSIHSAETVEHKDTKDTKVTYTKTQKLYTQRHKSYIHKDTKVMWSRKRD